MVFEWDENKNIINQNLHHINFETAVRIFLDSKRLEIFDVVHSSEFEDRYITIGFVGKVLTVVYTERGENIRIISARKATKKEEKKYYENYEFR